MDAPHSVSRAEPPAQRRLSVVLGGAFVLLLAVFFVVTLLRERPAPLPRGLVGLRFGMTEQEIRGQFPEVKRESDGLVRETVAFEQRARCRLQLNQGGRLELIECHAQAKDGPGLNEAAGKALAVARSVYGKESRSEPGVFSWQGRDSELQIRLDESSKQLIIRSTPTSP